MGTRIAFLILMGGGAVIFSLFSATINMLFLLGGLFLLLVAFVLFIKEIKNI